MSAKPAVMEFSLPTCPLDGSNLIEAGAGTGKTFTITGIVVRLLLEKELKIREILVVTYTNAATEELRDRIRAMIRRAVIAFTRGSDDDPFLEDLVYRQPDRAKAIALLKAALRDFDDAAVYTIHGFCQRSLFENAFESLNPFDVAFLSDERPLQEEIIRDFWRRRFYDAPYEAVAYALSRKYDLDALVKLVRSAPQLRTSCLDAPDMPIQLTALTELRRTFSRTAEAWKRRRGEIVEKLRHPGLHRAKYRNPDALASDLDRYLAGRSAVPAYAALDKFTVSGLKSAARKGTTAPDHPFFSLCEELTDALRRFSEEMESTLLQIKADLFRYVREELPRRKERQRMQSFDDLLANLHRALFRPENGILAEELQNRYQAALIDEFQDTDPVQYAIFRRIFQGSGRPLFLIGDPKQAIYSFRGADLFTYMAAREDVDRLYTLTRNWRAAPALIRAINTIFLRHRRPFVYPQVEYQAAVAAGKQDVPEEHLPGEDKAPLQIWLIGQEALENLGALQNRERTRYLIADAVTAEISRLLQRSGDAEAGKGKVSAGRIAVLVRDRYEARIIQEALRHSGIPNVLHGGENVFDTPEAEEFLQLIAAIAEPSREAVLRTALTTAILGLKGEDLACLQENDREWEVWLHRFLEYHNIWENHGFMSMFRFLATREKVRERILAYPNGERRLTNYLHLAEILHQEEAERRPGISGLVNGFARMHDPKTARREEHEIRLESDEEAVRIVTVHKSKGLEYPIVFCPFLWGGSRVRSDVFAYHERKMSDDGWMIRLALDGADNPRLADAERENLAENLRLFYVAVTRAKEACYVVWGPFKGGETSAAAYIFHPRRDDATLALDVLEQRMSEMTEGEFQNDLTDLVARSNGAIAVADILPEPATRIDLPSSPPEDLTFRTFSASIERQERIASFSYFIAGRHLEAPGPTDDRTELPDRDAMAYDAGIPFPTPPSGIFAFPRGARAGTLLHDILEHIDFQNLNRHTCAELVAAKLKEHRYETVWTDTIWETLDKLVHTPLAADLPGLSLAAVSHADRLNELEFYYPLKTVSAETLHRLFPAFEGCAAAGEPEQLRRLTFQPAKGFLKGFIDLVFRYDGRFYLVDWKSNHLGSRTEDYGQEALADVMRAEWYVLQYHLYVLALHRYLQARITGYDYERHFGGVFYIFLRGVDPAKGPASGIYQARPEKAVIDQLEEELIGSTDGS